MVDSAQIVCAEMILTAVGAVEIMKGGDDFFFDCRISEICRLAPGCTPIQYGAKSKTGRGGLFLSEVSTKLATIHVSCGYHISTSFFIDSLTLTLQINSVGGRFTALHARPPENQFSINEMIYAPLNNGAYQKLVTH